MSLLARFLETDPQLYTSLQELPCRLDGDNKSVETLREVVAQLIHVVENQQTTVQEQRKKIDELFDVSIHSINTMICQKEFWNLKGTHESNSDIRFNRSWMRPRTDHCPESAKQSSPN